MMNVAYNTLVTEFETVAALYADDALTFVHGDSHDVNDNQSFPLILLDQGQTTSTTVRTANTGIPSRTLYRCAVVAYLHWPESERDTVLLDDKYAAAETVLHQFLAKIHIRSREMVSSNVMLRKDDLEIDYARQQHDDNLVSVMAFVDVYVDGESCDTGNWNDVSKPGNLAASSSPTGVTLTWTDASGGSATFEVWRSDLYLNGQYQKIAEIAAGTTTYLDTTGVAGTLYFYYIVAVESGNTSERTSIVGGQSISVGSGVLQVNAVNLSTIPAGDTESLTVQDQNSNDITPNASVAADNVLQISIDSTANPIKTGQTTSYQANDDGDVGFGYLSSFDQLENNNPFGNTNRFTDDLGGQTYANDIVLDWATWRPIVGINVIGWYRISLGTMIWADAVTAAAAHSVGLFTSGWFLPNVRLAEMLINHEVGSGGTNYAPFNFGGTFWTSTTTQSSPTNKYRLLASGSYGAAGPTNPNQVFPTRLFTLLELGL